MTGSSDNAKYRNMSVTATKPQKIIAVMMFKGGAGKTTTANNLAAVWALAGKRVLLVDLDWQGNATSGVGFELRELPASINDLFAEPGRDPRTVIQQTDYGLDVLPASPKLSTTAMNMSPAQMFLLRELLAKLDGDYDVVVIDTPPGAGYMTYNALAAATDVLVPVAARGFSEEGLAATVAGVEQARTTFNPQLRLAGIVFTTVESRTLVSGSVLESVRHDYPKQVLPFAVPKAAPLDKGNLAGIPGVLLDPRHPAAAVYTKLARRLLR
jgi:chromosome partitioning protein